MKNYNRHNLVTFSNSILKHFGVEPFHETEEAIDKALKGHKKVALILLKVIHFITILSIIYGHLIIYD